MWASKQISNLDRGAFLRDARDYALTHGLVLRHNSMTNDNCVAHIPFTPFPSPYPERLYNECLEVQPVVNNLMQRIANDSDFIDQVLTPIAKVDAFTHQLLSISQVVRRDGLAQPIMSCISRADYMLNMNADDKKNSPNLSDNLQVRQVEVNAIASSMSAHGCNVQKLQEYLISKYTLSLPENVTIPQNNSLDLVAGGLIAAFDLYGRANSHILLVAEQRSLNFSEQFLVEAAVRHLRPDIKFMRRSFHELPHITKLGPNRELLLQEQQAESREVAVVYFRYGYDPSNYNFDNAWSTRLLLERSRAIKCPSISFHLSGAKKFQQVLNTQAELERYLDSKDSARLEKLFCKFWSIEEESQEGYREAVSPRPASKLVLKPQREGGGHNVYGEDIKPFVERMNSSSERSQYILMDYIDGPREKNWLLLHDDQDSPSRLGTYDKLVSELGIYGSILVDCNSKEVKSNEAAGYLVRSKRFGMNEGGVASGYAGVSSLVLLQDAGDLDAFFETSGR